MPLGLGADKRQLAALLEAEPSKTPLLGQVSTENPETAPGLCVVVNVMFVITKNISLMFVFH